MARWTPSDNRPVGSNEHIGRRLFDEPKLFGATDQNPFDGLDLRNFEAGIDRELSVDRVGEACFNPKVKRYLGPRAEAAATTFRVPRIFHGWLTVPARKLTTPRPDMRWTIVPSPECGPPVDGAVAPWLDADMAQNRYHAHVPIPAGMDGQFFAYVARDIFKTGEIHRAVGAAMPAGINADPGRGKTKLQKWAGRQRWLARLRSFIWGDD
jgi:hypothetical protein